jgi:N-acetylglucosaminyldiphosphoundecaprenol N-acetyl-beta-D-mannosaminyltransferase
MSSKDAAAAMTLADAIASAPELRAVGYSLRDVGSVPTCEVFGLNFASIRRVELEDLVVSSARHGRGGHIVTANLDILRRCSTDDEIRRLVSNADIIVADGAPVVWASRIARQPLPERVAGSDLIWTLVDAASAERLSVFLLGGSPGSADGALDALRDRIPNLRVAGSHCPPLGFEGVPEEIDEIIEMLTTTQPDVVFVGLGFPKQEIVIERIRSAAPSAWFIGVGVSIDFASGQVRRAPSWMHNAGLEWLYRLYREPRKLASRYLIHGIPFAIRLLLWARVAGLRRRGERV